MLLGTPPFKTPVTDPGSGGFLNFIWQRWIGTLAQILGIPQNKGDILVFDGGSYQRISPGADGLVLTADSTQGVGLRYAQGTPSFVGNETPSGTIDGANLTFTLENMPNPTDSLVLTKQGQQLYVGVGFTLIGNVIQYTAGYQPIPGETHRASYRY